MLQKGDVKPVAETEVLAFGPFRALADRRILLFGERQVPIGGRAFDVLLALLRRAGELVTKEELLGIVWPNLFVEDSNLRVNVRAARRALAQYSQQSYIVNVSGRGYRFVAAVEHLESPLPHVQREQRNCVPTLRARLVGRDDDVEEATQRLMQSRLLTIVGAGGVGKTSISLAVAERVADGFTDGVRFIDLSSVAEARLAPLALASSLGLQVSESDAVDGIVEALSARQMLIVLDTCEHVLATIAPLAERLMDTASGIHILATSREPLRIVGEREYTLSPLALPDPNSVRTPREALSYPAVELFVARAREATEAFELEEFDVAGVVDLCRRLDGIPLAIEIAAARVKTLGIWGLSQLLDDRFSLLMRGRSTALARQQTLGATLEWSYNLLPETEQVVLRRLAVFRGGFTLSCAAAILSFAGLTPADIGEALHELVGRSLITLDGTPDAMRYKLLDMTRAYASEQLALSADDTPVYERHARYFHDMLAGMQDEWSAGRRVRWRAEAGRSIDDVRAALNWAIGSGELGLAASLTASAAPVWFSLLLVDECRRHAAAVLAADPEGKLLAGAVRGKLHEVLGSAKWHLEGPDTARASFAAALDLAEQAKDEPAQLRGLWGLWTTSIIEADYHKAQAICDRFRRLGGPAPDSRVDHLYRRMLSVSEHFNGQFRAARLDAEEVLRHPFSVQHLDHNSGLQFNQYVTARTTVARSLWIEGFSEQAQEMAEVALADAAAANDPLSECYTLAIGSIQIAHWIGDTVLAAAHTRRLLELSADHGLAYWHGWGRTFERALKEAGIQNVQPRSRLAEVRPMTNLQLDAIATMAPRLASEETIVRGEKGMSGWIAAEMTRLRALQVRDREGEAKAIALLRKAIDLARNQGALAWELRAALSLAGLLMENGEAGEARGALTGVLGRFSEGHDTQDLRAAFALMRDIDRALSAVSDAPRSRRSTKSCGEVTREVTLICKANC